jgi:hypothetical protein
MECNGKTPVLAASLGAICAENRTMRVLCCLPWQAHAGLRFIGVAAGACWVSACAANLVIRARPDADTGALGPLQRCEAGETPCATDPQQDTSLFNAADATHLSLPNCPFGIQEILVQNPGSSHPVALVQCSGPHQAPAGADGGIPTMRPGGGTTSAR